MASNSMSVIANGIAQNFQAHGFSVQESHCAAALVLQECRNLRDAGEPVNGDTIAEAVRTFALAQNAKNKAAREEEDRAVDEMQQKGNDADGGGGAEGKHEEEEEEDGDKIVLTVNGRVIEGRLYSRAKVDFSVTEVDGRAVKKISFKDYQLDKYFDGQDPYAPSPTEHASDQMGDTTLDPERKNLLSSLCSNVEIATELGKHLRPSDIVNLFSVCKTFNIVVNGYMMSTVRTWINHRCPEAGRIFPFKFYRRHLISDPMERTWEDIHQGKEHNIPASQALEVRFVPGLKYLQLVMGRDRYCREIIAIMARNGHRTPPTMYSTLLRLWLLMDLSTTNHRMAMLHNSNFWSDYDLYNGQLFIVKLSLLFNDPVYGPCSNDLLHLILGQKGLYPLWQLLFRKRFTRLSEIIELKCRYNWEVPDEHVDCFIESKGTHRFHNVPFPEIGIHHLEGWGTNPSRKHLMRADELIPYEAILRGLALDQHIRAMMRWGVFDHQTGENLVPTEEEIYISDEEAKLGHMDTKKHWKKKHALKKRWHTLTPEQQQEIIDEEEDDRLRAMAFCIDEGPGYECPPESDAYDPNLEITRGWVVPPQKHNRVPESGDARGWVDFVNRALLGQVPKLGRDEALDLQPFMYEYPEPETVDDGPRYGPDFDWEKWLGENWRDLQILRARIAARTQQEEANAAANGGTGTGDGAAEEDEEEMDDADILGVVSDTDDDDDGNDNGDDGGDVEMVDV